MASGPSPRIGSNTTGLPYEDLSQLEKEAIEEAIRVAWNRLPVVAKHHSINLMDTDEETITRLLRDEIDKVRTSEAAEVPGFSEQTFQHIPEGENVPDSSGSPAKKHQKRPDLVFRPVHLPRSLRGRVPTSQYGLFVECKIIHRDRDHRGISDYCKNGISRFVDGKYASGMPSGMMVAYVRTNDSVPSCLGGYLSQSANQLTYEVKVHPELCKARRPATPCVYISKHGRSAVIVDGKPISDIELAHLRLPVS